MVQWLRLCAADTGGMGSISGQRTKIPHAKKKERERKRERKREHNQNPNFIKDILKIKRECCPREGSIDSW